MLKLNNKLLVIFLSVLLVSLSGCDKGSVFNGEQMLTDRTTRLEMSGFDGRVYEFTPKTAPHMQCVFVAASKKGGLVCFKKKDT